MEKTYWQLSAELPQFDRLQADVAVDVAIIGGGLTGITTAYLLKKEGVKVALIDRATCGGGDTARTTAHLTYVTDKRLSELAKTMGNDGAKAFWEAGDAAIDQIYELATQAAPGCEFRWTPGYLAAALDGNEEKERAGLESDAQLARNFGFQAAFVNSVPCLGRCGVRFEHQATFHPLKYLAPLLKAIPGDGSHVFENTEAHDIEDDPLAVCAGNFKIRCQYLVIATHTPLLGKTGIVPGTVFQSKLALYTSYVLAARVPAGAVPPGLYWDTTDPYYYLRVDPAPQFDQILFGGEDSKTGQEDERAKFARLEAKLKQLIPAAEVQNHWQGQVIETDDGLPFIGENAGKQFIATGFCGNGFTLGTLSAMMARDRYLGRKNPWFELFAVNRRKFHGGTWRYIQENLDYPYYLLRDRLAHADSVSIADLEPGEGKIIKLNGNKVAAHRAEDGGITLLSPVCPHLGCLVRWNKTDQTWDCPCHGSRFKADGKVFSGPAESDLAPAD
jgi:glycine/D-amino acid oxidase-like deaminating enzyme/nitrite reductase/ring-hydroxylating ferredoxin subunit